MEKLKGEIDQIKKPFAEKIKQFVLILVGKALKVLQGAGQ